MTITATRVSGFLLQKTARNADAFDNGSPPPPRQEPKPSPFFRQSRSLMPLTPDQKQLFVTLHNQLRAANGVQVKLTWSETGAVPAQDSASTCPEGEGRHERLIATHSLTLCRSPDFFRLDDEVWPSWREHLPRPPPSRAAAHRGGGHHSGRQWMVHQQERAQRKHARRTSTPLPRVALWFSPRLPFHSTTILAVRLLLAAAPIRPAPTTSFLCVSILAANAPSHFRNCAATQRTKARSPSQLPPTAVLLWLPSRARLRLHWPRIVSRT